MPTPQLISSTYEIREEIGAGGGGVVYKAWHTRLQKWVVLKKMHRSLVYKDGSKRVEVDTLKNLRHSYLPQVYDFLEEEDDVYTVIDFIEGTSLDHLLKQEQTFNQQQVVRWMEQLCEALVYLHGQNPPIIHSDIKPANIMLTPQGDICLIDFNIALLLGDDGVEAIGISYGYASPEHYSPGGYQPLSGRRRKTKTAVPHKTGPTDHQTEPLIQKSISPATDENRTELLSSITPSKQVSPTGSDIIRLDTRSDMYSLGATLYHLLTGERAAARAEEVKPLGSFGSFSEGVVYIIERCMRPDAAQRFQTAEEMLRAVRHIRKLDRRWKLQNLKKDVTVILLIALYTGSVYSTIAGIRTMAQEKEDHYVGLVYELSNDPGGTAESLFEESNSLYPGRIDAYHAKALTLMDAADRSDSLDFLLQNIPLIHIDDTNLHDRQLMGDLHYMAGTCYFEKDEYRNAIAQYKAATDLNESNPEYYRDYAISLARIGDIPNAEELLSTAERLGLADDSLALLRGEISYAKGDDATATALFHSTIQQTREDYLRYRAVRICSDAYKRQGDFGQEIALLESAKASLPSTRINEILERLGDAYTRKAQSGEQQGEAYEKAAACFEELMARGFKPFHVRQNLAIVYQLSGNHSSAASVLYALKDEYPNDYRVYMRLAYLYADIQTLRANESRDYSSVAEYFDQATALFDESRKAGQTDPELQMLKSLIDQLSQSGWL